VIKPVSRRYIDARRYFLFFWIASTLISAFILVVLQSAVAFAATFDNNISWFYGSQVVTTIRVVYSYPDTPTIDRPMNVSVNLRYLNDTSAIPKYINIQGVSVHLRTSVNGPNIFNSTIDTSKVTLTPAGKPYSHIFYITPTIPGKYFVLLNYNEFFGPPFKGDSFAYDEKTEIYPAHVTPINILEKVSTYANPTYGIKLQYPYYWQTVNGSVPANFFVLFKSPKESPFDRFQAQLALSVQSLPTSVSLNQTTKAYLNSLGNISGVKIAVKRPATVAGDHAYEVVFTKGGQTLLREWWSVNGDKLYLITYAADAPKYLKYLPIIQNMTRSIEITEPTNSNKLPTNGQH
jgi:hypothetical protein